MAINERHTNKANEPKQKEPTSTKYSYKTLEMTPMISQNKKIETQKMFLILFLLFHNGNVERASRVELLAQAQIREVQHPILGAGTVIVGVLAKVLQLLQGTTPRHLPQSRNNQLIDFLFSEIIGFAMFS